MRGVLQSPLTLVVLLLSCHVVFCRVIYFNNFQHVSQPSQHGLVVCQHPTGAGRSHRSLKAFAPAPVIDVLWPHVRRTSAVPLAQDVPAPRTTCLCHILSISNQMYINYINYYQLVISALSFVSHPCSVRCGLNLKAVSICASLNCQAPSCPIHLIADPNVCADNSIGFGGLRAMAKLGTSQILQRPDRIQFLIFPHCKLLNWSVFKTAWLKLHVLISNPRMILHIS